MLRVNGKKEEEKNKELNNHKIVGNNNMWLLE